MRAAILILALLGAISANAQAEAEQEAKPSPAPCGSAEHRAFDFWLGDWQVFGGPTLDQRVGQNRIERVSSGCALAEHWTNAKGQDGHSLSVFETSSGQWTQFWVGSDGVVLRLTGGLEDDDMLLHGTLPGAAGGVQLQRVRWSPNSDGSVLQRWETSDDSGTSWQTSFVGLYRRVAD